MTRATVETSGAPVLVEHGNVWARITINRSRMSNADEALAIGLVNEVVPRERLFTRSKAIASDIAAKAPLAICSAKKVLLSIVHAREPYHAQAIESIFDAWGSEEMRQRAVKRLNRS